MITQTLAIGSVTFTATKVGDTLVILVGDYTYTVLSGGIQEGAANLLLFSRNNENKRFDQYRFEARVPQAPVTEADVHAWNERWRGTFHEVAARICFSQKLDLHEEKTHLSRFIWETFWQNGWPE